MKNTKTEHHLMKAARRQRLAAMFSRLARDLRDEGFASQQSAEYYAEIAAIHYSEARRHLEAALAWDF